MNTERKESIKKISRGWAFKALLIAALVLLLLIPMTMIRSLVGEREQTAQEAENGIMESWGSELVLAGPVLVFEGALLEETLTKTEKDGEKIEVRRKPVKGVLAPKTLSITSELKTEVRRRGIFSVPLFYGEVTLSGTFDRALFRAATANTGTYDFSAADMIISLGSQKGIKKITKAEWQGGALFFEPGNEGCSLFSPQSTANARRRYEKNRPLYEADFVSASTQGVHARLSGGASSGASSELPQDIIFTIIMEIQGGRLARFMPLAQDTNIKMSADWASPSFQGAFLPANSTVTGTGFSAEWEVSYLSRDIPLYWTMGASEPPQYDSLFGVDFFRAIDTYSLNSRAVKYALLFLILPFLTLFLLEIFAKKRIHPVPYILSGIGNAVFYLLLLSLSEQMAFYTAYLIAACAVTALLTLYSRALLPSWRQCRYMGFVCGLGYILLYAVLNAESYALLIGSVGTFAVVALVMFLTRKLDWYGEPDSRA